MMMRKITLTASFVALMGLQGCGGGGGETSTQILAQTQQPSSTNLTPNTVNNAPTVQNSVKKPVKRIYRLAQKLEVFADHNSTTTYNYDGNYIATSHTIGTDGNMLDKSYEYDASTHILDIKTKNMLGQMELATRVTFEEGMSNKFINLGDENHIYLSNTYDPITYHDSLRVKEEITDIEKELFNVKKYSYQEGKLSTLTTGYQDSLSGAFTQERVHTYSYEEGLKIDDKAVNFNHSFNYSDDNKTVTEMADGKVLRRYIFDVVGG